MTEYNASIRAVPMPERVRHLPVSPTGYPVPWFVAWFDGVPDFRVIDTPKMAVAVRQSRCWVCGGPLGRSLALTIGPMCSITRCISEPPSHRDCAIFAAKACPFLANPRMRRNDVELPDHMPAAGTAIYRNPGAVAVWVTRSVTPFQQEHGVLFTFDDPDEVLWFAEGREATRTEVQASIDSGYPLLVAEARKQGPEGIEELARQTKRAMRYLPTEGV